MKPLRAEVFEHWIAVCELVTAEAGLVSVTDAQYYDAMDEWWQCMSWKERLEVIDALVSSWRRRPRKRQ